VQGDGYVTVERDGRVEDSAEIRKRHASLRFFVDKITELVAIQVEENPNGGAHIDATFRSITMNVVVEEPGSLLVDVHRPAPLVFTEHCIPGDVPAGDSKRGISSSIVALDGELPVMNSTREPDRTEQDTRFVTVCGDSQSISC